MYFEMTHLAEFSPTIDVNMNQWIGSTAIVTGASSGIGAAIAKRLLENSVNVVAIGRRLELLEKLNEHVTEDTTKLYPIKCDVTDENQIEEAMNWIKSNVGAVSILVNNAGIFNGSTNITDGDIDIWKQTIATNCIALCIFTKKVIEIMNENDIDGVILNVASISARYVPNISFDINYRVNMYPASKHAVLAISKALRLELRNAKSKIKVCVLSPGITITDVFRNHPSEDMVTYGTYPYMVPDDCADAAMYILSTPPSVQVEEMIVRPMGEFI